MKPQILSMRRYLALWLPFLPTDRLRLAGRGSDAPQDEARPFAFVEKQGGAQRLYALNHAALRQGLAPGLSLADARARLPQLVAAEADRPADAKILARLAARCERYTPLTALDEPHGLVLDVTGCAHLFGGETGLVARLRRDMEALGFFSRAALATTPDCARALARFSAGGVFTPDEEKAAVARLPLVALEAEGDILIALGRAGLKTIGDVEARSSRLFASRFGAGFSRKIERLFGREDIRIKPLRPPPDCMVERHFPEPLAQREPIEDALRDLMLETALLLERRGQGGRAFEACFFRADGAVRQLRVETLRPTRDPKILLRLFHEKLDVLADPLDPGFGFDALRLAVPRAEKFATTQADFSGAAALASEQELSELLDRLTTRFGRERVLRFVHLDTYEPERESPAVPAALASSLSSPAPWPAPRSSEPPQRPLTLFDPPQPVEVLALAPDGPPARFRWRKKAHDVLRAEGPERIAPEWAGLDPTHFGSEAPTRDYYRVEDLEGRRFWLFRRGLYERGDETPRWFLHGLFA
jgi:protein ImuB